MVPPPPTPRTSGGGRFDGTMVYGGWVLDVNNVNPSTPLAGRLSPRVFRTDIPELYLGMNGLPGEALRARAALFMDPREQVGSRPGDRFTFDTSSQISAPSVAR